MKIHRVVAVAVAALAGIALSLTACDTTADVALGQLEDCLTDTDDDGDGLSGCADPDCAGHPSCRGVLFETACGNGLDDDGDGAVDCEDSDCQLQSICGGTLGETNCGDGIDNDGNGLTDCEEQSCWGSEACVEICNDGVDNDGNGLADCADPSCAIDLSCRSGLELCNNQVDDDDDGLVDCQDPDCWSALRCRAGVELCGDRADNDGDGAIDCDDPDCATSVFCTGTGVEICNDGRDNDGDGQVDCADPDCSASVACAVQLACEPATHLSCNTEVLGTTSGGPTGFTQYPCGVQTDTFNGPEAYFKFTFPTSDTVTFSFSPDDPTLRLFSTGAATGGGCGFGDCQVSDGNTGNDQTLAVTGTAGDTIYLVIDSPTNASNYTLSADCIPNPVTETNCNDRVDDDLDGLIDCADPDCIGVSPCDQWLTADATCLGTTDCNAGEICHYAALPGWSTTDGMCTRSCLSAATDCIESVAGDAACLSLTGSDLCYLSCGTSVAACPSGFRCVNPTNGGTDPVTGGICMPE